MTTARLNPSQIVAILVFVESLGTNTLHRPDCRKVTSGSYNTRRSIPLSPRTPITIADILKDRLPRTSKIHSCMRRVLATP